MASGSLLYAVGIVCLGLKMHYKIGLPKTAHI